MIYQNSWFEISKVYDIGLQRNRNYRKSEFVTKTQFLSLSHADPFYTFLELGQLVSDRFIRALIRSRFIKDKIRTNHRSGKLGQM